VARLRMPCRLIVSLVLGVLLGALLAALPASAQGRGSPCNTNRDCRPTLSCNRGVCTDRARVVNKCALMRCPAGQVCSTGKCWPKSNCNPGEFLCSTPYTNTCCVIGTDCSPRPENKDNPCVKG
jgi:hypothetical protein